MPQEHEVTSMLQEQNTLIVEVACPEERNKHGKRMITGVFSHWDGLDPATNPGGVWLPITIEESGVVRVSHAGLRTEALGADGAVIHWSADIDSAAAIEVETTWSLAPATFSGPTFSYRERRVVQGGQESLVGAFTLPEPRLWWSHDLGRPDLYEATFEVRVLGAVSDTRSFRFGVRTFEPYPERILADSRPSLSPVATCLLYECNA
jgi:beta-mannosidase